MENWSVAAQAPAPCDWVRAPLATLRRRIRDAQRAAAERDARLILDSFDPEFLDRMGLTREDLKRALDERRGRKG